MKRTIQMVAESEGIVMNLSDLPPSLKKAVKAEFGSGRPMVTIIPTDRFSTTWDPNDVMSGIVLVDVNTGRKKTLPFGGRMGEFRKIDSPVPQGGAIISINRRHKGYVDIYIHPSSLNRALLPPPSSGLTDDEVTVLFVTKSYKAFARADYLRKMTDDEIEKAKEVLKANKYITKAGAITPAGRNYLKGIPDDEKKRIHDYIEKRTGSPHNYMW